MKWTTTFKCGLGPKIARRVSLQEMRQRRAWAQELARKAKNTKKEDGNHETK